MEYKVLSLNNFYKILFFIGFYISFLILYLSYDITLSPDFEKYYRYFKFYSGDIELTGLEQGHLYYFFTYFITYLTRFQLNTNTLNEIINISLHLSNNILFLIGLIGFYKYLIEKKFNRTYVYLSLILLSYLPAGIQLRLSFKPEILGFTFLGWLLYFLNKYKVSREKEYMYSFVLLFSLLITSKASLALMVGLVLLLEIWLQYREVLSLKYLKFYLIGVLVAGSLFVENQNLNGYYLTQVKHAENYNNKATLDFFTKLDTRNFKANPNRYFHSDSFISITLFDTFSDFFKLYWNSEYTELNNERKNFIVFNIVKDNKRPPKLTYDKELKVFNFYGDVDPVLVDRDYMNETRMRTGFKASIVFYFIIIIYSFLNRKFMSILLSPLIGIILVGLSASGIFGNNFDPLVGDSVKSFYYAFFVCSAFLLLMNITFKYIKYGQKTLSTVTLVFFLFLIGFPHALGEKTEYDLLYKNSLLPTCIVNSPIIHNIFGMNLGTECETNNLKNKKFTSEYIVPPIENKLLIGNIPFINLLTLLSVYFLFTKKYFLSKFKNS
tara:strand:+ start:2243 stop:3898 length:1656 start_codon:yes stop_codon:yes gene_type:complete